MVEISDEIIQKAALGDAGAFEQIYRAFSGLVYGLALRVTRHQQDAEEVTQEVFVKIYHSLKKFRFQSALKTWIYRIAVNHAVNYSKRRSRQWNTNMKFQTEAKTHHDHTHSGQVFEEDHKNLVDTLLGELPEDQRACLVLRSIQGLSYQEIADTLDVKINTVRTRLKRAREKLLAFKNRNADHEI